jgi:hypothetical protein
MHWVGIPADLPVEEQMNTQGARVCVAQAATMQVFSEKQSSLSIASLLEGDVGSTIT